MCRLPGPGEHGKNGARHAKRIGTRRPRAGLLRGRHPRRLALAVRPGLEGRKVLSRQFPADAAGYEALAGAIAAAGEPACVAMEGTSSWEAYRALMRPHEIRRPEDASGLVAARRAAKVSQVRAASILGTSEKYISMLERGQRELKPIRRAYEAWVEAGLPLDWDRQAFEAERKMDSKKHLAK